ncbi:MAG: bifunctional (p)ppGpp synthetase/guanosine-3',5'-bis(diphosphate) 3'-pyrophosphohydrolase [Deltaproteobacteria bacterium]|nr:bifunctional (p)ppGpp synthetase/guanosine-3',5'-bis(diphosphate) 3'-pyrophosphohydrolase [Deltaproteobacteria bacterium]
MIRIKDIVETLLLYFPGADTELIQKAYIFSAKVHQGQTRLSGEPYLIHPLQVASLLTQMKLDEISVATGLLHDTIEDTATSINEIQKLFGAEIALLVDGLTKLSELNFRSTEEQQAENFRKMLLSMAKDIRVILIKLADRLHNMRTLVFLSPEKQKIVAQETLDIYAPIANRLGIDWIKSELEDLAFKYLHPAEFNSLDQKVKAQQKERDYYIEKIKKTISEKLIHIALSEEIKGRVKHYPSIYKKMISQKIDFDQVQDLIAFRIIVGSIKDCYEALGVIHSVWKPVPGRFKDFIAMPKANMYQSLHTTVIGPYGERMEIQIRTPEMHRIAEEGIAAHWRYKEGREIDKRDDQIFSWLRQILEWQQDLKDPREFMETFRTDLFPEEVYVFTPKGEVKAFPRGATPIDFAYSIHTDVGNRCVGARVNSRMVPIDYEFSNGDTIEIITANHQRPRKDWLKIVKTSRSRTKIRQWLRLEERNINIQQGKDACQRAFKKYNLNFMKVFKSGEFAKVAESLGFHESQDLLASIGYGKVSVNQLFLKLVPQEKLKQHDLKNKLQSTVKKTATKAPTRQIRVKGLDDIWTNFAKCCNPLPGDSITGYITKGKGVSIHVAGCPRLLDTDPERQVPAEWTTDTDSTYPIKIKVISEDKPGLLAEITGAISRQDSNIRGATISTKQHQRGVSVFEVEVKNVTHMENIIRAIQNIKGITRVLRVRQ